MKGYRNLFLVLGLLLFILGYVIIVYQGYFNSNIQTDRTGQIGDTIGGVLGPIINFVGVILVYISFRAQTSANDIQTKQLQSQISWNHYQVAVGEFEQIKNELSKLRFDFDRMTDLFSTSEIKMYENTDGIYYQELFAWIFANTMAFSESEVRDVGEDHKKAIRFRNNVIYPLHKIYDKLYELLKDVQKDENISIEFKKKLYKRIEIDLLQIYLRFCNNETFGNIDYDFRIFDTTSTFDHKKDFFRINDFYLNTRLEITDENLLQYKNLQFYKATK